MNDIYQLRTRRNERTADLQDSEMIRGILKKIPKLPAFANSLMTDVMNDEIPADRVAEKIQEDPALVGVVLKTINSTYYGLEKKVSDIQHAVTLLGFNQLVQLISAAGIRRTMPDLPVFRELHLHCMAISQIAFSLSKATQTGKPTQVATIGLLHDLGQVVILLLQQQNPKLAGLINALDRAQIGGLLLKSWGLPDIVWKSIEYQFFPEFSPPGNIPAEIQQNIAVMYVAHLCYDYFQGRETAMMPTTFINEYMYLLKLEKYKPDELARVVVLPVLVKNINSLPATLRNLIKEQQ